SRGRPNGVDPRSAVCYLPRWTGTSRTEVAMPRYALVGLLLAVSLAHGAGPPCPGSTAGLHFEYVEASRMNLFADTMYCTGPFFVPWREPTLVLGVTFTGEGALADWFAEGRLAGYRVLLPSGLSLGDGDAADLERCYQARGFIDVRVSTERVQPGAHAAVFTFGRHPALPLTIYRVQEGPRYRLRKQVSLAGHEPQ